MLVTVLYGSDGYELDSQAHVYDGDPTGAILRAVETKSLHGFGNIPEYWTSTNELMATALSTVGVAPKMKAYGDTKETKRTVQDNRELLIEFHNIERIEPKEEPEEQPQEGTQGETQDLAKWRRFTINLCEGAIGALTRIITKLSN